jgi:hypothetical protein
MNTQVKHNDKTDIRAALDAAHASGAPVTVTYASGRRLRWRGVIPKQRVLAIEERPYLRYDGAGICVEFEGGQCLRIGQIVGVA